MLIAAPAAYLIVVKILQVAPKIGGEMDMMFYILLIVAAVQPATGLLIERFHVKNFRVSRNSRMSPAQLFTSISLIKFALVESVYLYGLIVYIVSGSITRMLYFYPVGAVWSVAYWPRHSTREKFRQAIEAK